MPPFTHLEFHRSGIGLVPEGPGGKDTAIYVAQVPGSSQPLRSCTCAVSKKKTCDHLRAISRAVAEVQKTYRKRSWAETFAASVWHRLGRLLFDGDPQAPAKVLVVQIEREGRTVIRFASPSGRELAEVFGGSEGQIRLLERTGKVAARPETFDRAELLERLALFQCTREERALLKAGMKTQRQSWEESFWYRLAYHCERELEPGERGTFHPAIDESTGDFTLTFRRNGPEGPRPMVQVSVPRSRVGEALALLAAAYPEQDDLAIRPLPLRSIFHVSEQTALDVGDGGDGAEVRPVIQAIQATGEARFLDLAEVEKFRYGSLIWLKDLGILAEIEREGKERKFRAPARLTLKRHQIPGFLAEHAGAIADGVLVLDAPLRGRQVFQACDRIEIAEVDLEEALQRSWYWLAVEYGFGSSAVSLASILAARRQGIPYLEIPGGWIDLNSPAFRALGELEEHPSKGEQVRLSASDLLRLQARAEAPLHLACGGDAAGILDRLLHLRPPEPFAPPRGLATPLRGYQRLGAEWLRFLVENRLGGLLCDEMGLGKTLQTLTLMAALVEEKGISEPFLVVCPTSVLPHWHAQVRRHAPGLRPLLHHGVQRRLPSDWQAGDVLLTSYGVLRRDAGALASVPFVLAVFDEIQQVKNRQTQSWEAAARISAGVRLGLTGTPVENSLADLKTLFDLVLPGYLGTDAAFAERYLQVPDERDREETEEDRRRELRRTIAPFVLRRRKAAVLDELPEKIEDLRTCVLSEDQVRLYRDAVEGRGAELARQIEAAADEPLPYIHVFALLNLLKQICDHPALALGRLDRADDYASGKWDLFREVLQEALDSGLKAVVFTQYLGMVSLMERHLTTLGVGHATLTGSTGGAVRRGEVVDRFNHEPDCRVFLGSLKAGGTGIDLVGGSVVIHYDRWWNAAREDQATDRVHRIGQKRAVQVLKLITEGTLEEKIAALIDRKRRLSEAVVQDDDPHLAKIFTREELLEMLRGD